jgi:hypothetical protein
MAFRAAASTSGANAASPGACNLPAGIQVGDYLLAFWSIDTAGAAGSPTVPTGWTKIGGPTDISGPDTQTYLIYERIADGNESSQRTWSGFGGNNFACIIAAWSGRDTSTPKTFITNSTPNTSSNASPVSVALTGGTAAAGDDIAWFAAIDNISGASGWSLSSAPSGFTGYGVAQFQWGTAAFAHKDAAAAGATGTLTGTLTEAGDHAGWSGFVVAIKAAGGGGGTDTPMTISVVQAQTLTRARAAARSLAPTQAQALTRLRAVARAGLSSTHTQAATLTKNQGFLKALSAVAAQAAVRVLGVGRTRTALVVQAPSTSRSLLLTLALAVAQTLTRIRAATRALAANATQAPALVKGQGFFRTLSVTASQALATVRTVGVTRSANATATATLAPRSLTRNLAAVAAQALIRARALARALTATAAQVGSADEQQQGGGTHAMGLTAAQLQTLSLRRAVTRLLAGTQSQPASASRAVTLGARTATQAQAPSAVVGRGYFRTLTAIAAQSATRARALAVAQAAAASQVSTSARGLALLAAAVATQAATRTRALGFGRAAAAGQSPSQTAGAGAQYFVELAAACAASPSLRRIVRRLARAGYVPLAPLETVAHTELVPLEVSCTAALLPYSL